MLWAFNNSPIVQTKRSRDERGEIQSLLQKSKYKKSLYKQFYVLTPENLEKMDRFLDLYNY